MKTILVSVLHNNQAMGFLANDCFELMAKNSDLKVVVVCPPEKLKFYQEHYSRPNVIFETFKKSSYSKMDNIFEFIMFSMVNTKAVHYRQKYVVYNQGGWFKYLLKRLICYTLGSISTIQKIVRWLDNKLVKNTDFDEFFEKYKPNLALVLDILHPRSINILRSARKFEVFNIGIVRSWDNLSSK